MFWVIRNLFIHIRSWYTWFQVFRLDIFNVLALDMELSLLIYANNFCQELEPFPELDVFDRIRKFQQDLCEDYTSTYNMLFYSLCKDLATFHRDYLCRQFTSFQRSLSLSLSMVDVYSDVYVYVNTRFLILCWILIFRLKVDFFLCVKKTFLIVGVDCCGCLMGCLRWVCILFSLKVKFFVILVFW